MSHYETTAKDIVPLGQKAAYGTGTLVLNLLPAALGIFAFFLI
jgi:GPH family glycoside/pentoside/hexuronide:cation symporter